MTNDFIRHILYVNVAWRWVGVELSASFGQPCKQTNLWKIKFNCSLLLTNEPQITQNMYLNQIEVEIPPLAGRSVQQDLKQIFLQLQSMIWYMSFVDHL